jgi:hypothetical protein
VCLRCSWLGRCKCHLQVYAQVLISISGCISSVMRLLVSIRNLDTGDRTYDWFPEFLWT